jgi:hypothetical protein
VTRSLRIRLGALGLLGLGGCAPDIQYAALDPSTAPAAVTALAIDPGSARLSPGDTVRFRASTINSRGQLQPATGATFSTTGGTITSSGLYQAVDTGSYQVQARYQKGSTVWTAVAQVVVEGTAALNHSLLTADRHPPFVPFPLTASTWCPGSGVRLECCFSPSQSPAAGARHCLPQLPAISPGLVPTASW